MEAGDHNTGEETGLERIAFFSDAVIAIAITLLALDIKLPEGAEHFDSAALGRALVALAPKYVAYIVSFFVIGQFWVSHHLRFRYIRRFDATLIWLNLAFLMVIGFTPFASAVLSTNSSSTAHIFYNCTMIAAALLSALLWAYATANHRLVDADLDPRIRRRSLVAPLAMAGIFAVSSVLASIDVHLARWCWLLLVPAAIANPHHRMGRRLKER
jgi:uncharacterized membrane protein